MEDSKGSKNWNNWLRYTVSDEIVVSTGIVNARKYLLNTGTMTYAKVLKTLDGFDIKKIVGFLKSMGYVGIYDIEFKHVNGATYFIEINFRHGSPGYALTRAGVNIPFLWYLGACGFLINDMKKKSMRIIT